jgi:Fe-S cluster assembly protein SufD
MELKEKFISSFLAVDDFIDSHGPIYDIRKAAIKSFEAKGFPTKKTEAWKYTSLKSLLNNELSIFPKKQQALEFKEVRKYFIHDIDTYKIVFIDGKYSSFLSQTTHDGVDVCLLSAALGKDKYRPIIENYFNRVAPDDGMTSLNTAFAREGAYIYIPKHKEVEKPIEILNFYSGAETGLLLQPRNLVVVEDNAHAQIIERHQSLSENAVLTNSVTEIFLGPRAHLDWYKIQNDHHKASLIDNTFIKQERDSIASVHTFSFGGKLTRNNLNFYQHGQNASSVMKGVTLIEDAQHVDHNTLVHHIAPNCTSHQDYKGVYDDKAVGVFNGKIFVEKEAQKLDAFQQNNNILISDKAIINSKPQLEIFADDVKCSHGCTIGQLDQEALFYMRARGIAEKEAKALLMYAFANNVLESVDIPELKKRINKLIALKMNVHIGFDL